ncbi:JAB domain-containing protein [Salegentibacter sp. F188]|jgi:DNA repair protein RadC|uniref:JAB domain-containing protein n=1 Tax=Autumnicola patrickiae TaxID=3075591 RepID=A0ABU3E7T4_9FLAO|nr:JAB domain-containing protein [Salegentibacter sp. F188]MDT0691739.1 JAB domain-containing protein [Salegentibacter sp. F188]
METKVNEIAISYSGNLKTNQLPKITSSQNAAELLYGQWNKNNIELHETFKIMLLNNANKVKGIYEVSTGGITGTLVDLRILFAVVLKSLTTAVILAHNHPSGTLTPSEPDKRLTQKIKKAGELFDIKVLDHLILTPDGNYFSFADEGIL